MYVLDTNCIIYYSRNDKAVVEKVDHWVMIEDLLLTSTIVEAELFAWPDLGEKDAKKIEALLSAMAIIPVYSPIARAGAAIRQKTSIHLADALIAATALIHQATLVTRNVKDFAIGEGLEIERI